MTYTGPFVTNDVITEQNLNSLGVQKTVAGSRPAAAREGVLHFATDTGELSRDTGSAWETLGFLEITDLLTADDVETGTAFVDTALTFAIAANEKWLIKFELLTTAPTNADIKWDFTAPAGATAVYGVHFVNQTPALVNEAGTSLPSKTVDGQTTTRITSGFLFVENAGTAGNVTLRHAKTGAGTDATLMKGSFLQRRRTA